MCDTSVFCVIFILAWKVLTVSVTIYLKIPSEWENCKKSCLFLKKFVICEISIFLLLFGNLTRNKLMFEFSLAFPMLKIYIGAIVFSMKKCLLLFHDIIYRRVWSTFFSKVYVLFSQNISLSYFFGLLTVRNN